MTREAHDTVARNSAVIFALLTLVLIGLVSFQHTDYRNFKTNLYERCMERLAFDQAANDARIVQAEEFEALGDLAAQANLTPEDKAARKASYYRLAGALRTAVEAQVKTSCERYKP